MGARLDADTHEAFFTGWSLAVQSGVLAELPDPLPSFIYDWHIARLVHVTRLAFDTRYLTLHDVQDALKNLHRAEGSPWLALAW